MTAPPHPPPPPEPRAPSGRLLAGLIVTGLVALWLLTPLRTLLDRRRLAELGHAVAASPVAPGLVVAVYVVGGLVLFPITPLLAATALVFTPTRALGVGLAGALSSAAVLYAIGRGVGRHRPSWLDGPRVGPLRVTLRRRGVVALTTLRLVPVGNFSVSNLVAGAIEIPLRDFLLGNALGLLPTLVALTVLARALGHLGWLTPGK